MTISSLLLTGLCTTKASVEDEELEELLTKLERAATVQKALKKEEIVTLVDQISSYASEDGLEVNALATLADIVSKRTYLDNPRTAALIKSLIPRGEVPNVVVCRVVCCFGGGQTKPGYQAQADLMKWLVMVYSLFENYEILSKLYNAIFNCIYMIWLRPHACHLLLLITKRKHVKPFRIQALLELQRQVGDEPALMGLLRVYKNFYPDVIVGNIPKSRSGLFKTPDPGWMENLMRIQEATATSSLGKTSQSSRDTMSRARSIYFPKVQTFEATENSATLEEVDRVSSFVNKIDKIELPSQVGAVFNDAYLQQYLALRRSDEATERLENWVEGILYDEEQFALKDPQSANRFQEILRIFGEYAEKSNTILNSVDFFLLSYLKSWDGMTCQDNILKLLSYIPLLSFEELFEDYFKHIEIPLMQGSDIDKAKLIEFYTSLIRNWIIRYSSDAGIIPSDFETQNLRTNLEYMDGRCVFLFEGSKGSLTVLEAILGFFEAVCSMPLGGPPFRIFLPADSIIYGSVFAGSVMSLSRICGVLMKYKKSFMRSAELAKSPNSGVEEYPRGYVDHFNGFLMDVCNSLWRNRSFKHTEKDQNALGCNITDEIVKDLEQAVQAGGSDLSSLFALSHSFVLALFSIEYFRDMEASGDTLQDKHAGEGNNVRYTGGPITLSNLRTLALDNGLDLFLLPGETERERRKALDEIVKQRFKDYKLGVITEMKKRGLVGLNDLMNNTMVRK